MGTGTSMTLVLVLILGLLLLSILIYVLYYTNENGITHVFEEINYLKDLKNVFT